MYEELSAEIGHALFDDCRPSRRFHQLYSSQCTFKAKTNAIITYTQSPVSIVAAEGDEDVLRFCVLADIDQRFADNKQNLAAGVGGEVNLLGGGDKAR